MRKTIVECDICHTEIILQGQTMVIYKGIGTNLAPLKTADLCSVCYTNLIDVIEGKRCFPPKGYRKDIGGVWMDGIFYASTDPGKDKEG